MSVETIERDIKSLALKMHQVVVDDALTPAEKQERYEKMDADLKAFQQQYQDAVWLDEKTKNLAGILGGDPTADPQGDTPDGTPKPVASVGEQLTCSEQYKSYVAQVKAGGGIRSSGPIILNATLTTSGITGTDVIAPDRRPGMLPILFERLTIADLMPSAATTAPTVRYVKEITATNAASTVAEEGLKPEADLDWDTVDEPVRKIAVILRVADEMLEDFDQFQGYANGRLVLFVRLREEAQLLKGAGTGNDIAGILNRAGLTAAQPKGGDTIAIAVHKELTKVRVASFLDPDAIVFHPNDWEAARLEQDQNDQFYGGGPFTGPYGNNGIAGPSYWGLRTVVTQAMTENTVLLGAFATAAQVFRRSGITVDMTNSDGEDFRYNRTAIRAEERLALAVYRESAFGTVTGV